MAYTTIDNPELYFQAKLFTGNGSVASSTQSITFDGSEDMQPDWVWFKKRDTAEDHELFDSVRGVQKAIDSNNTNAEATGRGLTSFNSDGFTVGNGSSAGNQGPTNEINKTFVTWNWKAGTSFTNDASSTGIGSIDSAGSVNNDAGISICTHTGTGSTATIKHGLSTAPKMIITKKRSATGGWQVGHESIGWGNGVYLNDTDASTGDAGAWNSTAPTSSIFTVGNSSFTNQSSATYVSYIFAEKQGYSKFGSYTGNGNADGSFIYTGQKSAFIIVKNTSSSTNWEMFDNKRVGYNESNWHLKPNSTDAEDVGTVRLDILSNGFKIRTTGSNLNTSGNTYIYMAFAESPFTNSNGIPNNAR